MRHTALLLRRRRNFFAKGIKHEDSTLYIGTIPSVLYKESANCGYIFFHSQMGHREGAQAFAHIACTGGQVLAIDLLATGSPRGRDGKPLVWTADIHCAVPGGKHWLYTPEQ